MQKNLHTISFSSILSEAFSILKMASCIVEKLPELSFDTIIFIIEISFVSGRIAGQALALYVDGDRIFFENCRFLGHQDTLFSHMFGILV